MDFERLGAFYLGKEYDVDLFALAWVPHWRITYQDRSGIARTELVPAY